MKNKFIIAAVVVSCVLGLLIYAAVKETSKPVVTVEELVSGGKERARIRLGARVADGEIRSKTSPSPEVRFFVRDIAKIELAKEELDKSKDSSAVNVSQEQQLLEVVYYRSMPDTLKAGRDVILEGDFNGKEFIAKELMTQCPSKYTPPDPTKADSTKDPTKQSAKMIGGGY